MEDDLKPDKAPREQLDSLRGDNDEISDEFDPTPIDKRADGHLVTDEMFLWFIKRRKLYDEF